MTINRVVVTPLGNLDVTIDGRAFVLSPGSDVSQQPQEIQDLASRTWTPAVLAAYADHKREQNERDAQQQQEADASTQVYLAAERARIRAIVLEVLDERGIRGDRA